MPLYIEKINGDVNQPTDRPIDRQGEYRAICLFRKFENRKRQRFAMMLILMVISMTTCLEVRKVKRRSDFFRFGFWRSLTRKSSKGSSLDWRTSRPLPPKSFALGFDHICQSIHSISHCRVHLGGSLASSKMPWYCTRAD